MYHTTPEDWRPTLVVDWRNARPDGTIRAELPEGISIEEGTHVWGDDLQGTRLNAVVEEAAADTVLLRMEGALGESDYG